MSAGGATLLEGARGQDEAQALLSQRCGLWLKAQQAVPGRRGPQPPAGTPRQHTGSVSRNLENPEFQRLCTCDLSVQTRPLPPTARKGSCTCLLRVQSGRDHEESSHDAECTVTVAGELHELANILTGVLPSPDPGEQPLPVLRPSLSDGCISVPWALVA